MPWREFSNLDPQLLEHIHYKSNPRWLHQNFQLLTNRHLHLHLRKWFFYWKRKPPDVRKYVAVQTSCKVLWVLEHLELRKYKNDLSEPKKSTSFEIVALFPSRHWRVKSVAISNSAIFFGSVDSFLYWPRVSTYTIVDYVILVGSKLKKVWSI